MTPSKSGYIYLLGSARFGWYKIGRSKKPSARIKDLGILLPFKVTLHALWKSDNAERAEREFHEKYSDFSINGEWFGFGWQQVRTVVTAQYDWAYKMPTGNCILFSNLPRDVKIQTKEQEERNLKGRSFMEAVRRYMTENGLESTKENRSAAKRKIKDIYKNEVYANMLAANVSTAAVSTTTKTTSRSGDLSQATGSR